MRAGPSPHIPGLDCNRRRPEPRLSDLILGIAVVLGLISAALTLLAAVAA